jgi:general L-amino acid transport system permease protein
MDSGLAGVRPRPGMTETMLSFVYQKKFRDLFWQAFILVGVLGLFAFFIVNASRNMRDAGIASGFDFLFRTAGIEVPFVLTDYTAQSDNLALLWVGIVNTMLITLVSAATATVLGFVIGIARLSRNWLLASLAGAYVEAVRNIPLLFFVLFWYFGVIATLPGPRESIGIFGIAFLNNRGLTIPLPNEPPFGNAALLILAALAVQIVFAVWARRRRPYRPGCAGLAGRRAAGRRPAVAALTLATPTSWDVRRCAASTIAAASCWCRNSSRCSPRSPVTRPRSSPRSCAAAFWRCPRDSARRPPRSACGRRRSCASWSSRRRCA